MFDDVIASINNALFAPLGQIAVIAALFALAWLTSRLAGRIALRILARNDRREAGRIEETGQIANLKRRETLVAVVRGSIGLAAFAAAFVLSISIFTGGVDRLTAIAGASFAAIVAGFAAQRVLGDLIAGFTMFLERWYSVGDTVILHAVSEHQGVVEDVSLRQTRLRTVTGEVIHVNNSAITAVRVLPRGAKRLAVELFVSDRDAGERLVEGIARLVPTGPTTLLERPSVYSIEELSESLTRISLRATVAPGREWLVEGFLVDLLNQRADEGLIAHGPVVLAVDEGATKSYARATAATRIRARRGLAVH